MKVTVQNMILNTTKDFNDFTKAYNHICNELNIFASEHQESYVTAWTTPSQYDKDLNSNNIDEKNPLFAKMFIDEKLHVLVWLISYENE